MIFEKDYGVLGLGYVADTVYNDGGGHWHQTQASVGFGRLNSWVLRIRMAMLCMNGLCYR